VLENGRIVRSGSRAEIEEDKVIQQAYLGLESERTMSVQAEAPVSGGGFYNPAARAAKVQQAAAPQAAAQVPASAVVSRANPGGFYNPYSRSVGEKVAPARDSGAPAAPRTEKPKSSGGFYNPSARPGSGH